MTGNEYPDFLYTLFLGQTPTANTAEATGNVSTITNKYGTSAVDATTGIASVNITSGDSADLKFGKYVVVVQSNGTTVEVYHSSDIDIARGTDGEYQDDLLKITESPIAILDSSATTVVNAAYGIELIGGSGTVSMTAGDTATFEVRPPNSASTTATFGATTDTFPEFGCLVYGQQRGSGEMIELDIFKCKALGMPHNFNAAEFSQWEITAKCFYDSGRNGVFSRRTVIPV